ncbi:Spy/CpxP family protein refolding chaperone [Novipirellula rosea]|uniref:Periplasmic heavy metal sensor n=1 Tax=Novipirellula rosea TaxID=1031540 RepID=A0ABP8NMW2_9BACT
MFTRNYPRLAPATFVFAAFIAVIASGPLTAQTPTDTHANHTAPAAASGDSDLKTELQALRTKVEQLEAALESQHQARYGTDASKQEMSGVLTDSKSMGGMKKMGGIKDMKEMSQDTDASSKSGGMSVDSGGMGMGGMGMKKKGMGMMSGGMMGMKGMGMMGRNPAMKSYSMSSMNMSSALPGFPGASHLYHIGETGFFLDHPQHITLSAEQQKQLNEIKESALLATATAQRKIDEAEQQLWQLTGADQPDINKIEAKAKEIASLNVSNRIEFIRAVGKAAEVLTDDQRQVLVGMATDTN